MIRYAVVIERAGANYSAFAPDVAGCLATGETLDEVREQLREALEFHLEGMRAAGLAIPELTTLVDCAEVEEPTTLAAARR